MRLLLCVVLLGCVGCVLPSDLEVLKMEQQRLIDGKISYDEYNESVDAVAKKAADRLDEMGKIGLTAYESTGVAGLLSLLGAVGLNLFRNGTRKKALAEVKT